MKRVCLSAMFLAGTSSLALATTINLGPPQTSGSAEAKSCFAMCTDNYLAGDNVSVRTSYSEADNRTVLGKATALGPQTSVYAHAVANTLNGGVVGADFFSNGASDAYLDYRFEIVGPTDTLVTLAVQAMGTTSVNGDFTSNGGGAGTYASLYIGGQDINIQRETFIQGDTPDAHPTLSSGFDASGTYYFHSNTDYEVQIRAKASAAAYVNDFETSKSNFVATAFVDPTFTVDPSQSSQFRILYSTGIGAASGSPSPVPLPASAPLFGASLVALGLTAAHRRRRRVRGA